MLDLKIIRSVLKFFWLVFLSLFFYNVQSHALSGSSIAIVICSELDHKNIPLRGLLCWYHFLHCEWRGGMEIILSYYNRHASLSGICSGFLFPFFYRFHYFIVSKRKWGRIRRRWSVLSKQLLVPLWHSINIWHWFLMLFTFPLFFLPRLGEG